MPIEIVARIHFDADNLQLIVRKAVKSDEGFILSKYGLSTTGEWIEVPEATIYPDDCYLPIAFWNSHDSERVKAIVESLQAEKE